VSGTREHPTPEPCCGVVPGIKRVIGSRLRLRLVGCETCRTTGKARMTDDDAVDAWNNLERNAPLLGSSWRGKATAP